MTRWTVHKEPGRLQPWRAWQLSEREATEHGPPSQRSAFAYALLNAAPRAVVLP